jgi:hypothetical protein
MTKLLLWGNPDLLPQGYLGDEQGTLDIYILRPISLAVLGKSLQNQTDGDSLLYGL